MMGDIREIVGQRLLSVSGALQDDPPPKTARYDCIVLRLSESVVEIRWTDDAEIAYYIHEVDAQLPEVPECTWIPIALRGVGDPDHDMVVWVWDCVNNLDARDLLMFALNNDELTFGIIAGGGCNLQVVDVRIRDSAVVSLT